jgi:hypothetical protein
MVTFAKACESGTNFVTTADVFTDQTIVIPASVSQLDCEELNLLHDIFEKLNMPTPTHRILCMDDTTSIFIRAFSQKDACHLTMRAIRDNVDAWCKFRSTESNIDAVFTAPTFIEFNPNEFHILKLSILKHLTCMGFSVFYVARKSAVDP